MSQGVGPSLRDFEPIDELVDEENQESTSRTPGATASPGSLPSGTLLSTVGLEESGRVGGLRRFLGG